ncbi:6,7-dimethyl-8-ribityllumazine synthase [archaeon]|nr:6,7-dimethyl-8-ribityllumazine synthase [archaeon]
MSDEPRVRLGIVVSEFNYDITYLMLQRALEHAEFLKAKVVRVLKVPGTFEVPLGAKTLLEDNEVDAVVALGAVVEGATQHDEVIAQQTARKLLDLSLEYGKPVALGISGPGMTRLQGFERVEEYARRAVDAAVKMVERLREAKQSR